MKKILASLLVLTLCLPVALGGCASTSGKSYSKTDARQTQTVQRGVIKGIQEVTIEEDASGAGTGLGGVLGGVLGSTMGRGRGRILSTAGGAAVGAVLGTMGEKALRTERAFEFEIDLDNGQTISVVQAVDGDYRVGDRVRVLRSSGNRARVTHENQ
ncbi:MAG: Outer membrane lipoprotein SlyB [Desulfovibrio sp.]